MRRIAFIGVASALALAACAAPVSQESPAATQEPTTTTEAEPVATSSPVTTSADAFLTGSAATFDESFLSLGPGEGFPVLDNPVMVTATSVTWLDPDDVVLGVVQGDEAHAFPASQMAFHHIVNTTVAGEPYLVTY